MGKRIKFLSVLLAGAMLLPEFATKKVINPREILGSRVKSA